jgi:transcriptional regulator with XRE-family HTH domain
MNTLGEYLQQLRTDRHLTLRDIADIQEVSTSYISRIERGSRVLTFHMLQVYHKIFVDAIDRRLALRLWLKSVRQITEKGKHVVTIPVSDGTLDKYLADILERYLTI